MTREFQKYDRVRIIEGEFKGEVGTITQLLGDAVGVHVPIEGIKRFVMASEIERCTMSKCRACQTPIFWKVTANGKRTPVDPDGETHWATCPGADKFKRKRE